MYTCVNTMPSEDEVIYFCNCFFYKSQALDAQEAEGSRRAENPLFGKDHVVIL